MSDGAVVRKRSYRAERDFGLAVGTVLALLGAWWVYRGKFEWAAPVFLCAGAVLVLSGLAYPRALVVPNRGWMALAGVLSFVMTRVVLALVFFLLVTPIGVVKRLTGWDPLGRRKRRGESYWQPYPERQHDPRHFEKMY
jgi:Saxitoxin biosynthesis operon protein SxtJ